MFQQDGDDVLAPIAFLLEVRAVTIGLDFGVALLADSHSIGFVATALDFGPQRVASLDNRENGALLPILSASRENRAFYTRPNSDFIQRLHVSKIIVFRSLWQRASLKTTDADDFQSHRRPTYR